MYLIIITCCPPRANVILLQLHKWFTHALHNKLGPNYIATDLMCFAYKSSIIFGIILAFKFDLDLVSTCDYACRAIICARKMINDNRQRPKYHHWTLNRAHTHNQINSWCTRKSNWSLSTSIRIGYWNRLCTWFAQQ